MPSSKRDKVRVTGPVVTVVDEPTVSHERIVEGLLYLKSDDQWVLGKTVVTDKYLLHFTEHETLSYFLQDLDALRVLSFWHYFDHNVFELDFVNNRKASFQKKKKKSSITEAQDNSSTHSSGSAGGARKKPTRVTFRAPNFHVMSEWVEVLDDLSDGVWMALGMMPKPAPVIPTPPDLRSRLPVYGRRPEDDQFRDTPLQQQQQQQLPLPQVVTDLNDWSVGDKKEVTRQNGK